jgi:hypothetical protein
LNVELTLSIGHRRQTLDGIDRNGARLEHLVLQLLLLQLLQLVLQLCVVDLRPDVDAAHCLGNLLVDPVVFLEFIPAPAVSLRLAAMAPPPQDTYMVSSTLAGVSLPCIDFMASLARCIAMNVSWLIFADSIAFICDSMVPM